MFAGKKCIADKDVIAETKEYFEIKYKSYYKNGMEKMYDYYNRSINYIYWEIKSKLIWLLYQIFSRPPGLQCFNII